MNLYTATITLILVMDPLGNIPIFISVLNSVAASRRRAIVLRETFIAFLILLGFLFFGKYILSFMQISGPALSISGGIILFLIALRMIFPHEEHHKRPQQTSEPFIVPLAIPLVAGPSALAFVMLLAEQSPHHLGLWTMALLLAWLFSTIVLVFADQLRNVFGERGLIAIERLMGMILTTMAVQMFLSGVEAFFHLHK